MERGTDDRARRDGATRASSFPGRHGCSTGTKQSIEKSWGAMERWMELIQRHNPDFVRRNALSDPISRTGLRQTRIPTKTCWRLLTGL